MSNLLKEQYGLFINGEFKDSAAGETLDVTNPATGEVLAKIAKATEQDVDAAVKSAEEAFKTWRHTSHNEKARLLNQIADKMEEHREELAN